MIYVNYICNGCGIYTQYKGKNEKQLNVIEIDLTNYVMFTTGFIMKEPKSEIHLCDECYSKIIDGEINIRSYGNTELMKHKIKELENELHKVSEKFNSYKRNISSLLRGVNENK